MPTMVCTRRVRTADQQTHALLLQRITSIQDCTVARPGMPIKVDRKRNMLRNRWAMTAEITVAQGVVTVRVDGPGSAHRAFSDEIFGLFPEGMIDDQGLAAAMERMRLITIHGVARV